ncbi:MAG: hypothetical protein JWN34_2947 [Bryobacterales bacterium]|nr:hypothetical protein [Bryobacterales bacterium]
MFRPMLEFRDVRTSREIQAYLGLCTGLRVELMQTAANVARGYADYAVLARVVRSWPAEQPNAKRAFLEFVEVTSQRHLDNMLQELLAPAASFESGAPDNLAQVSPISGRLRPRLSRS